MCKTCPPLVISNPGLIQGEERGVRNVDSLRDLHLTYNIYISATYNSVQKLGNYIRVDFSFPPGFAEAGDFVEVRQQVYKCQKLIEI